VLVELIDGKPADFNQYSVNAILAVIAGIPYACFTICAVIWSTKGPGLNYTRAFEKAPFVIALFCLPYFSIMAFLHTESGTSGDLKLFTVFLWTFGVMAVSGIYWWSALAVWTVFRWLGARTC